MTEVIGTFVLVFLVLLFGNTPTELGPLAAALLVVGIGPVVGGILAGLVAAAYV